MASQGFKGQGETVKYLYQDNSTVSMAFGIDGLDSNIVKLVVSPFINATLNTVPAQILIDANASGTITLDPGVPLGTTRIENGDFNIIQGNLNLPVTDTDGGAILIGGFGFAHAYGAGGIADSNSFFGVSCGNYFLTGTGNTSIGTSTLTQLTTGSFNFAGAQGSLNGLQDGDNNVAIGYRSLDGIESGDNNVALGHLSGSALATNESGNILIGANVTGTIGDNNVTRIGSSQTSCFIAGIDGASISASVSMVLIDSNDQLATLGGITNGQIPIGSTGVEPLFATLTAGSGVSVTNGAGSITIAATGLGAFAWTEVTGTSATMAINNGYIANNAGLVTLTLPGTAALGSIIRVAGKGAGLWSIAQVAGQTIHFGTSNTTTGVGGSLTATAQYDCIELLVTTANTDFVVLSSLGNITVV